MEIGIEEIDNFGSSVRYGLIANECWRRARLTFIWSMHRKEVNCGVYWRIGEERTNLALRDTLCHTRLIMVSIGGLVKSTPISPDGRLVAVG
jgi:hypothetical protein